MSANRPGYLGFGYQSPANHSRLRKNKYRPTEGVSAYRVFWDSSTKGTYYRTKPEIENKENPK